MDLWSSLRILLNLCKCHNLISAPTWLKVAWSRALSKAMDGASSMVRKKAGIVIKLRVNSEREFWYDWFDCITRSVAGGWNIIIIMKYFRIVVKTFNVIIARGLTICNLMLQIQGFKATTKSLRILGIHLHNSAETRSVCDTAVLRYEKERILTLPLAVYFELVRCIIGTPNGANQPGTHFERYICNH